MMISSIFIPSLSFSSFCKFLGGTWEGVQAVFIIAGANLAAQKDCQSNSSIDPSPAAEFEGEA
jgi:hypothetical protein